MTTYIEDIDNFGFEALDALDTADGFGATVHIWDSAESFRGAELWGNAALELRELKRDITEDVNVTTAATMFAAVVERALTRLTPLDPTDNDGRKAMKAVVNRFRNVAQQARLSEIHNAVLEVEDVVAECKLERGWGQLAKAVLDALNGEIDVRVEYEQTLPPVGVDRADARHSGMAARTVTVTAATGGGTTVTAKVADIPGLQSVLLKRRRNAKLRSRRGGLDKVATTPVTIEAVDLYGHTVKVSAVAADVCGLTSRLRAVVRDTKPARKRRSRRHTRRQAA